MSSRLCPFCMRAVESDICPHCSRSTDYAGVPMHLPAGYVVRGSHPYVIGAALGQGGFGITYIALDMVTNERVAIKEFFPTFCAGRSEGSFVIPYQHQEETYEKGRERFLDEARVLKSLSDLSSIVNVLDFFEFNNSAYLVMEFLEGGSLKEHVTKNGKFPAQSFLAQIQPLIEDIHRMHQRGVIHRDIAPDNIILLPDGQMKLIDFGAARSFVGDRSMTVVVKKGFAPLEQYLTKGCTASTDVYAMAATIYYCTTGIVPADSAARQCDNAVLPPLSSYGADFTPLQEAALKNALEIQISDRTQTMQEFLDQFNALETASSQSKAATTDLKFVPKKAKTSVSGKNPPNRSRSKKPIVTLAFIMIALILGSGLLFSGNHSEPTPEVNLQDILQIPSTPVAIENMPPAMESNAVAPADRITEPVTLSVLASQYSNQSADWWKAFETEFESQYSNVDLNLDVVSWNDIYTEINTRIANGQAPDILNIDTFAEYQADGLLLPVQSYLSEETYQKFHPNFLDFSALDGEVWAVPDLASVSVFFYNKTVFDALNLDPPTTWSDIEDACKLISKQYPKMDPIGLDMTTYDGIRTFGCFALSNGGGFTDSNGNWIISCEENVQALEFLNGLVKSKYTNDKPDSQNRYELQDLFASGQVAMMISTESTIAYCKSYDPSFQFGVVPIPAMDGKSSSTLAAMDRFMCFENNQSDAELAAITCFYDFLYEDSRYVDWVSMEGFIPATSTGSILYGEQTDLPIWNDVLSSATFMPAHLNDWSFVKNGIIEAMQKMLTGKDPAALLENIQKELSN